MAQLSKITKRTVDALPLPAEAQVLYFDSSLPGFGIRVSPTCKAYFAERRVHGKTVRVTIGRHGVLTPEQARKEASRLLGQMTMGENPIALRRRAKVAGVTLGEAFEAFASTRRSLKPRTVYDYRRCLEVAFGDWKARPIRSISRDMVQHRHAKLWETRGEAYANLSMRFLRSLLNFAAVQYDDGTGQSVLTENPVARLSLLRAWYRVERRQTVIKAHQLPRWFEAVQSLSDSSGGEAVSETVRDYLLLLLFTGLRRQEGAQLKWSDVDLTDRTLLIRDTKNRDPHRLPLPEYLLQMLRDRKARTRSPYVFPGRGPEGYLIEPRHYLRKVVQRSGVHFTLHDLRRTFVTVAEGLDIPAYALKRLINHRMSGDVTAGYIITDVERLRRPMQQICDFLLKAGALARPAEVVALKSASSAH
jgi:integrase